MAEYSKSASAERDLIDLWEYIAEDSEKYANLALVKLEVLLSCWARFPMRAELVPTSGNRSVVIR